MNISIIITFALVLVLILGGAAVFFLITQNKKKSRTMALIRGKSGETKKSESAQDEQNRRRDEISRKLKESQKQENKAKKDNKASIPMLIAQAGLQWTTKKYWIISVVCMVVCVVLSKLMGMSLLVVALSAVVGLLGLPRFFLKQKAKRRQKNFLKEFPDALEAVVRLLKAGMPVAEAVSMISREFDGPVGEEMTMIYNKQKIGIPLHEAAMEAGNRMPLPEVKMFATGLAIQAQTGSSLSEVLTGLSNVIRERFKLKRKVKALSSEAIASASIIGSLPILLSLGMYFANREYIQLLFDTSTGNILLGCAITSMSIGIIVMKVMINFKI